MLQQGAVLMVLGMGVVFVLLSLLVLAVKGMAGFAARIAPPQSIPATAATGRAGGDAELIAVVTAAVHAYRRGTRQS